MTNYSIKLFQMILINIYKILCQNSLQKYSAHITLDELVLSEQFFKMYQVQIFNRWGHLVYMIKDQTGVALWDGDTSEGVPCTDGVYFYRVIGEMLGGTAVDRSGFVTVIGSK